MEGSAHVPVFRELLERADVSLLGAVVYGALAHFESVGVAPRAQDIADAVGGRSVPDVRLKLIQLEKLGLIRRDYKPCGAGTRTAYVLLGPKLAAVEARGAA